jgi:hypothetical protein
MCSRFRTRALESFHWKDSAPAPCVRAGITSRVMRDIAGDAPCVRAGITSRAGVIVRANHGRAHREIARARRTRTTGAGGKLTRACVTRDVCANHGQRGFYSRVWRAGINHAQGWRAELTRAWVLGEDNALRHDTRGQLPRVVIRGREPRGHVQIAGERGKLRARTNARARACGG